MTRSEEKERRRRGEGDKEEGEEKETRRGEDSLVAVKAAWELKAVEPGLELGLRITGLEVEDQEFGVCNLFYLLGKTQKPLGKPEGSRRDFT